MKRELPVGRIEMNEGDWRDPMIPSKYKQSLPYNLYSLSSRQVTYLKRMMAIIEGMEVPKRMVNE